MEVNSVTIRDAIEQVDRLKPNQYTTDEKVRWLSVLDGQIWREAITQHDMPHDDTFSGYDVGSDMDTELLVQDPYAVDIYINYLQSRIDRENAEISKYNQSITMYNTAYNTWLNLLTRTYRPLLTGNYFKC